MEINKTTPQRASNKLPPPEQAFEWPRQAMLKKNWLDATQRWAILREVYPEHPATWIQGATAHIETGELEQAETLLNHARQQFPNNPNALVQSTELAIRKQDWNAAKTLLQQARGRFPDNLQIWLKSAEYAEHLGNHKQAVTYFEKAQQCAPNQPIVFIQHAELSMRTEQWEQALTRWETLRTNFPDIPAGYLRAAEAARQLNRHKEARQLVLTHQYGPDIFNLDSPKKHKTEQSGNHTNLIQLLELIWTKAIFNLRSEVHRNYLSYTWWILEPLLYMVIYYIVFGLLLQRGGENFTVFLLTGLIPWMWFSKAVGSSSNSILAGQNLMLQVGVPSVIFPLICLLQATIKQIPVFILLFCFVWSQGFTIGSQWWALIPIIAVQALLTITFACTAAAVIPFIRDLSYLVPTGLTFLMFLSGVFYDYRTIPEEWQAMFLLNPIAFLLKCYREVFIDGILPDLTTLAWWGFGCATACLLLMQAYKHLRYVYPRIVME